MAEIQDNDDVLESAKSPSNAAKEAKEEELRSAQQAQQAKGGTEPKEPLYQTHTSDGVSHEVGDIRSETLNLQQGNNTFNFTILQNASKGPLEDIIKKFGNGVNQFGDAYEFVSRMTRGDEIVLDKDADKQDGDIKLPETPELIEDWYCDKLNEWETCFVQAAVVLHGAPVHQISDVAESLYHFSSISADGGTTPRTTFKISEKTLHSHLYMKKVHTQGAERLFWSDANTSGLSSFAMRLLPIIINQSSLSATSRQGLNFRRQLEIWSTTLSGECAWRATRALGGVWLNLDSDHLRYILNEWVSSDDPDDWRRAATLLDGAYEVEYADGEQINQGREPFVLPLLMRWTNHAHASFQANFGSTVAQAYGRIGQRSIAPALEGLEKLLRYPLRRKDDRAIEIPLVVFFSGIWSYVTLARFGYVREVLQHLASLVEKYCYQRRSPQGKERREYRAQCSFMLEVVVVETFFLIAAASLNGVKDNKLGNYKPETKLEQRLVLPDKEGKDMLLSAILSREEANWRQHIITILCGAILEKNAENAFYLMKVWAEIILKERVEQRIQLREAFIAFMLEIGGRGNEWCHRLVAVGEYYDPDLFALNYKRMLQKWQIRKSSVPPQPLGAFAKDVFRRLNF